MLRSTALCIAITWTATAFASANVNTATEAELDSIKGIGPRTTAIILAERAHGPFKSWRDLMTRVKGIKPASATRLSANGLTVDDASFTPEDKKAP